MSQRLTARVTDDVGDAFDRLRADTGVTYTAFMQALGEQLAAGDRSWIPEGVLRRGRAIDRERGSRR